MVLTKYSTCPASQAGQAVLLSQLLRCTACRSNGDSVHLDDVGATADAMYQHANSSTLLCVISDFPSRTVATNALHIGQQVHEKRIGAERR